MNQDPFYEEEFAGYKPIEFGLYAPYEENKVRFSAETQRRPLVLEKDYTPKQSFSAMPPTLMANVFGFPLWMVLGAGAIILGVGYLALKR